MNRQPITTPMMFVVAAACCSISAPSLAGGEVGTSGPVFALGFDEYRNVLLIGGAFEDGSAPFTGVGLFTNNFPRISDSGLLALYNITNRRFDRLPDGNGGFESRSFSGTFGGVVRVIEATTNGSRSFWVGGQFDEVTETGEPVRKNIGQWASGGGSFGNPGWQSDLGTLDGANGIVRTIALDTGIGGVNGGLFIGGDFTTFQGVDTQGAGLITGTFLGGQWNPILWSDENTGGVVQNEGIVGSTIFAVERVGVGLAIAGIASPVASTVVADEDCLRQMVRAFKYDGLDLPGVTHLGVEGIGCLTGEDNTSGFFLTGGSPGTVFDIEADPIFTYYAGNFDEVHGAGELGLTMTVASDIVRHNRATNAWEDLTSGSALITTRINTIALAPDGQVYVGGVFDSNSPNVKATNIARWNGSDWFALTDISTGDEGVRFLSDAGGEVHAIEFVPDPSTTLGYRVYVGGNFIDAGGTAVKNIAVWTGLKWEALKDRAGTVDIFLPESKFTDTQGEDVLSGVLLSEQTFEANISPTSTFTTTLTIENTGTGPAVFDLERFGQSPGMTETWVFNGVDISTEMSGPAQSVPLVLPPGLAVPLQISLDPGPGFLPLQDIIIQAEANGLIEDIVKLDLFFDCNNNGIRDSVDIAGAPFFFDANSNGVIDTCETALPPGSPPPEFVQNQQITTSGGVADIRVADVDNDNDQDLVAAVEGGLVSVAINDGTGSFVPFLDGILPELENIFVILDVDCDGFEDLVTADNTTNPGTSTIHILEGEGNGLFDANPALDEMIEEGVIDRFKIYNDENGKPGLILIIRLFGQEEEVAIRIKKNNGVLGGEWLGFAEDIAPDLTQSDQDFEGAEAVDAGVIAGSQGSQNAEAPEGGFTPDTIVLRFNRQRVLLLPEVGGVFTELPDPFGHADDPDRQPLPGFKFADLNADGQADLIEPYRDLTTGSIMLSVIVPIIGSPNTHEFDVFLFGSAIEDDGIEISMGELIGDGATDIIVRLAETGERVMISNLGVDDDGVTPLGLTVVETGVISGKIALADFDGDGLDDLAEVISNPPGVSILRNIGGGSGCNSADIAEPFDILDLADITAFTAGFLAGDAIADLAEPFGVLDLADIGVFVAAFIAGCHGA